MADVFTGGVCRCESIEQWCPSCLRFFFASRRAHRLGAGLLLREVSCPVREGFGQRSRGYSGLSFDKTWDARHRVLCLLPVFQGHLPLEITMRDIGVALVSTRAATYVDDTAMNQEVQW